MLAIKKLSIVLFLMGLCLLSACGGNKTSVEINTDIGEGGNNPEQSRTYILGADISSLAEYVDNGAVFVDTDGVEKPMLALLKKSWF
jgi:arabinogalactan endo-1,4-beta-galactosidase